MTLYDDVRRGMLLADRNDRPWVLWKSWPNLTTAERADLIPDAWVGAEWPLGSLGEREWLRMFKEAGYTFRVVTHTDGAGFKSDVDHTTPPKEPIKVWRGAALRTKGRGMSWTLDEERAVWFAERWVRMGGEDAGLFEAMVPAKAVLGMFNDRAEQEVVVNPNMLRARVRLVRIATAAEAVEDHPAFGPTKVRVPVWSGVPKTA